MRYFASTYQHQSNSSGTTEKCTELISANFGDVLLEEENGTKLLQAFLV
jgi:hypothetical protein